MDNSKGLYIGDRVCCVTDAPEGNELIRVGMCGTIVHISYETPGKVFYCGVRWDSDVDGHSCSGYCEDGHGWNVRPEAISPCDPLVEPAQGEECIMKCLFGEG